MTAKRKIAQKRLTLLQLAEKLRNVSEKHVVITGYPEAGFTSINDPYGKQIL